MVAVDLGQLEGLLKQQLGKPYVFGAAGPGSFDCSGLVQYVFKPFGINLPHHSEDQARMGTPVRAADLQPGDLVFSDWGDGPNSHVGIAVSKTQIIDAPHTGAVVRYDTLSSSYLSHVTAIRRMTPTTGSGGGFLSGVAAGVADATGIGAIADAIKTAAAPLAAVGRLSDQAFKIFMPTTFVRVAAGAAGGLLLLWGVLLLAREARA